MLKRISEKSRAADAWLREPTSRRAQRVMWVTFGLTSLAISIAVLAPNGWSVLR